MDFESAWGACVSRLAEEEPGRVGDLADELIGELGDQPRVLERAEAIADAFFAVMIRDPRRALAEAALAEAGARRWVPALVGDLVLRRASAQLVLGYPAAAAEALALELRRLGRASSGGQRLALLSVQAQALLAQGRVAEALVALEEALALAELQPHRPALGVVLSALGNARLHAGRLVSAADYYRQALEHGRELDSSEGEAINLGNLALVLHLQGEHDQAEEAYAEAVAAARAGGDLRALTVLAANRGLLALEQGDLDLAEEWLEDARRAAAELHVPGREAHVVARLARLARERGELERAASLLEEARLLDPTPPGPDLGRAERSLELARLALARGQAAPAAAAAREARQIADLLGQPSGVAWGQIAEGQAALAAGRPVEARALAGAAWGTARDIGQPSLEGQALTLWLAAGGEGEEPGPASRAAARRDAERSLPAGTPARGWLELALLEPGSAAALTLSEAAAARGWGALAAAARVHAEREQ